MALLNTLLGRVFDVLLAPVAALPAAAGLALLSVLTAVAMLLVFKRTSDQERLAGVKRSIHAALFEIRLFNDDLRAVWRAQLDLLRQNLTYLRLSLVPMLWMLVPLTLVVAQLQFHFGYAALAAQGPVLVKAELRPGSANTGGPGPAAPDAALAAPSAVRLETPAVWLPAAREIAWRVIPEQPGEYELELTIAGRTYTKTLQASGGVARRSPFRLERGFANQLLYPSEAPLPDDGPVRTISVAYPEGEVELFGWRVNWLVLYVALSMVCAFALRKRVGVVL
jgi:uncharacterized membrane protein (DUF106 family)